MHQCHGGQGSAVPTGRVTNTSLFLGRKTSSKTKNPSKSAAQGSAFRRENSFRSTGKTTTTATKQPSGCASERSVMVYQIQMTSNLLPPIRLTPLSFAPTPLHPPYSFPLTWKKPDSASRFRQATSGHSERFKGRHSFAGEDSIDHTAKDESEHPTSANAFVSSPNTRRLTTSASNPHLGTGI